MEKRITFVGLDAHKESTSVTLLLPGQEQPVECQCANERASVRRMVRKVLRRAEETLLNDARTRPSRRGRSRT